MQLPIHFDDYQRHIAAAAIEASIHKIAKHFQLPIERCIWNCDTGMDHSGPHRLDVYICGLSIKTYFTDNELASYWSGQNTAQTDVHLYHLIHGLHELIEDMTWSDLPRHCWTSMNRNVCANVSKKKKNH